MGDRASDFILCLDGPASNIQRSDSGQVVGSNNVLQPVGSIAVADIDAGLGMLDVAGFAIQIRIYEGEAVDALGIKIVKMMND